MARNPVSILGSTAGHPIDEFYGYTIRNSSPDTGNCLVSFRNDSSTGTVLWQISLTSAAATVQSQVFPVPINVPSGDLWVVSTSTTITGLLLG